MSNRQGTRQTPRQLEILQVPENAPGQERLDRLTSLLAEALARRLGQAPQTPAESPAAPLDYPPVVSPTTGAKSAVPTEELK